MRKLEKPRKHILNTKVDIDTLKEIQTRASIEGVSVSTFIYEALKSKLTK